MFWARRVASAASDKMTLFARGVESGSWGVGELSSWGKVRATGATRCRFRCKWAQNDHIVVPFLVNPGFMGVRGAHASRSLTLWVHTLFFPVKKVTSHTACPVSIPAPFFDIFG